VAAKADPVSEIQNIEDQSADRHDVVVAGRDCFETLLGFGPEASDHGFVRFNVDHGYGGEGGAK
jgi:hypothetical protein